ncbi:MAG: hypothetical protein H6742_15105 [Alphaproteobacteria bacterium]|nr:hypothetical protein [Alphaproteobacteria bacterium]
MTTLSLLLALTSSSPVLAADEIVEVEVVVSLSDAAESREAAEACAEALELTLPSLNELPFDARQDPTSPVVASFSSSSSSADLVEHDDRLWLVVDGLACELSDEDAAALEALAVKGGASWARLKRRADFINGTYSGETREIRMDALYDDCIDAGYSEADCRELTK